MTTFLSDIIAAITGGFTQLGQAVIDFIRNGFIWLFCTYTEDNGVYTISGLSPFAYFIFVLMGISLCLGLCYFLVNMARRSK